MYIQFFGGGVHTIKVFCLALLNNLHLLLSKVFFWALKMLRENQHKNQWALFFFFFGGHFDLIPNDNKH
jgi:hypothetical protein